MIHQSISNNFIDTAISNLNSVNIFSLLNSLDVNVKNYLTKANTIDLSLVKARTLRVHPEWTIERADSAVEEYKKMLVLAKLGVHVVPSKDIDEIWHSHILFTKSYAHDCDYFFGYFLHHKPADGSSNEETENRRLLYTNMISMYKKYFCQEPPQSWIINYEDPCGSMGCDVGCEG